ncbi:protein of unknown function [Sphingobacterium lactis]|uniref:DUF4302 domain-containing protein n=2 Tax=Sphingobacterium lactis TaxID=797291 RepID=A0A1H5WWH6_9SPHI|nr:protein of unknown function [Sphingobacterium lactis]
MLILASCQKNEVELAFGETPEVRMNEKIDSINKALQGAPNGWKAYVGTGLKGGYGFYFEFDDQQVVKMVGDLTLESATKLASSNYRVKQDNGATLIFDTYNYISMLNDPNPSVFGGTIREGLRSDLDYRFGYSTADSMVFIGKRYSNKLVLVKATPQESQAYKSEAYTAGIEKTKKFFLENENPYVEFTMDGFNYQTAITLSEATKIIELSSLLKDGTTGAAAGKFAFSLPGVQVIDGGIAYAGINFVQMVWEGNKLNMVDDKGKKYEIKNSLVPLVPLYKLIGSKYTGFRSPFMTFFPGTSADGLAILKRYHEGLGNRATGYIFNYGYIDLDFDIRNKRLNLKGFSSQNGGTSGWITTIVYDYTLDSETGIYTFTLRDKASGGYTSAILDQMDAFLKSGKIKLDYYSENGALYGKIIGVDKPNVEMTFQLR